MISPLELIRKSFRIFFKRDNFINFLKIYAVLVPFAAISVWQDSLINSKNINLNGWNLILAKYGWWVVIFVVIDLFYIFVSFWVGAAGIKAIADASGGGAFSPREVFRFVWRRLWIFIVLSVVVGLVTAIGFLLLVIPGIIFLVWFRFSSFELITKKVGIKEAIKGSRRIVSGKFFPVFGRFLVFGVFTILVQIIFGLIPFGIGEVISPLFGALTLLPYFLLYRELA